ncbi:hypothetical protein ACOME3_009983 [Neoechinorhynchus agilis]
MMMDPNDPEIVESLKYLEVSKKERLELQSQEFDSKVMCWVPDEKEGFVAAKIVSKKKNDIEVKTVETNQNKTFPKDQVEQMNPPKFEKCEDMADLTYLNDPSVLHNLRARYSSFLIYTYSGLFCVVINPYKRLPIYTEKVIAMYRGKKRTEVPPHLFAVTDNAYANMLRERENQSMLITGESGAGKTENTKKVIQYFATVAANQEKSSGGEEKPNLEDQIVSANPLLESYGNAKTVRNNNSSRFGKFIRIHFGGNGRIAGADIATYLLEKARVIFQQKKERNYHIFYQLTSSAAKHLHKDLLIDEDPSKYQYIAHGSLTVDGIDDSEEMVSTIAATKILGFTEEETMNMFKCTASLMHFGNSKWKQRPREEQAESEDAADCEKVAFLLGIEAADLIKGLLKPRIKVGSDYVNKGQNKDQVVYAIGALSKSIYERLFLWMVNKINKTLDVKTARQYFIGVLDIAGFEIFEYNGFEQLCINYTNEMLQQFFNHHMFVLEQEEYTKEGIEWNFIDFGMDLQACIDLIEKPMGLLSILEEECIIPKGSDEGFLQKITNVHFGKHPNISKPKVEKGKSSADFNLHHYAGIVPYSINGWLEKNKDPINTTIATLFANSKNALLAKMFKSFASAETEKSRGGKRGKKGGSMQTISAIHREQLNTLLTHLRSTHPHFVRCIIPNEEKKAGLLDVPLVLNQLHCNGVLEGIRICRKGFPNRMIYSEFKQRYSILAPNAVPKGFVDAKKATVNVLKDVQLSEELYRVGNTKIFFKAGVLGQLEDMRDVALSKILTKLQARIKRYVIGLQYKRMLEQKLALEVLQRNCNKYLDFRNWPWWRLYTKVKPLLSVARQEEEMKMLEEEYEKCKAALEKEEALRKQFEEQNARLTKEKNDMYMELEAEKNNTQVAQEKADKLVVQKADLDTRITELNERLEEEEENVTEVTNAKRKLQSELDDILSEIEETRTRLMKSENETKVKESEIKGLKEEIAQHTQQEERLAKDKKKVEQQFAEASENLKISEEKINAANRTKVKLEQTIDEVEDNLNREKKRSAELEKVKRKLESDLNTAEAVKDELERIKGENESSLKVKDTEITSLQNKLEDEEKAASSANRKVKELQAIIAELEEEVEVERSGRSKAERQRADLIQEMDDMADRLDAAGSTSVAQTEITKKREAELAKLRRDLDEATAQHEATVNQLKKKHQDAVNEMGDQTEQLQRLRSKLEKDKQQLFSENEQFRMQLDHSLKAKTASERQCKELEQQLTSSEVKLEQLQTSLNELSDLKNKLTAQNEELVQQLEDAEYNSTSFAKLKQSLQTEIAELQAQLEDEKRSKGSLMSQLRNMTADFEAARNQLDEEIDTKAALNKQIISLNSDVQQWKTRFETEGLARAEELEDAKRKVSAKLSAAEETVELALNKCSQLENAKNRLQAEVEDLMIDVERANANATSMEKKQKQFDKTISEWSQKCDDIVVELETSQKEARAYSGELFKLRSKYEDCLQEIESLRRDNKNLSDEIREIMEQTSEEARNIHEMTQEKKRLELEKEELQAALEEAEASIEQEETKTVRLQMELSAVRQDIDRKLREKEEEFDNTRRNHQRLVESMQATLEAETKAKQEAMKQKKNLETDVNELEVALDQSNRTVADLQKGKSRLEQEVNDIHQLLEDEQLKRDEAREAAANAERRLNLIASEIEELSSRAEQAERLRRIAETDMVGMNDRISELSTMNSSLGSQKKQLEDKISGLQLDLDEAIRDLKNGDQRLKTAALDAAKLSEELQNEQDRSAGLDTARKQLEIQIRDLQSRYAEMEANSIKGGKRIIQKLQEKVQGLSDELDLERRAHQEAVKLSKKNERKFKELSMQVDEERRNHSTLQDTIEKLRLKLRTYKRQAEEAEEVAAINLEKYRKAMNELGGANERAESAEVMLSKLKARSRGGLMPGDATTTRTGSRDFSRSGSMMPRSGSIRPE